VYITFEKDHLQMQQPNAMNVKWILATIEHSKIISKRVFEGGKKKASKSSIRLPESCISPNSKRLYTFACDQNTPKTKRLFELLKHSEVRTSIQ